MNLLQRSEENDLQKAIELNISLEPDVSHFLIRYSSYIQSMVWANLWALMKDVEIRYFFMF